MEQKILPTYVYGFTGTKSEIRATSLHHGHGQECPPKDTRSSRGEGGDTKSSSQHRHRHRHRHTHCDERQVTFSCRYMRVTQKKGVGEARQGIPPLGNSSISEFPRTSNSIKCNFCSAHRLDTWRRLAPSCKRPSTEYSRRFSRSVICVEGGRQHRRVVHSIVPAENPTSIHCSSTLSIISVSHHRGLIRPTQR